MWASTPVHVKLLILAAETTVCVEILAEDAELTRMLKDYQECVNYIRENY